MPSFDIVSKVDYAELDNALNNTRKEIATRYDFRNSRTELALDKKEKFILVTTEDTMKLDAVREMFLARASKRGIDLRTFEFTDPEPAAQGHVKRKIKIKEGLQKEVAQQVVRLIKEMKIKVQPSIQGEEVRVTAKQIDDLQSVIAMLRGADVPAPLQFVNFK